MMSMDQVLTKFGHKDLIAFLKSILTYATSDGWCYPLSESAQTVTDVFAATLDECGVRLLLDHKVISIRNP